MANYSGGGGGGAAVVPATQVVASDREDQPLTQAGLVAAIADLPAGGGDIYIGAGTLTITSTVSISKNVKLIGAGIGATVISIDATVVAFSVGAFEFSVTDLTVTGDASAGQTFILVATSAAASKYIILDKVFVSNPRIIIDADNKTREIFISKCNLVSGDASGTFILDGNSVALKMSDTALTVTGSVVFPPDSKVTTSSVSAATITVGSTSLITSTVLSGSTSLTANASCSLIACVLSAVTAGGDYVHIEGCTITSFTSSTNGLDFHIIVGNRFTGAGNNCTLTDCDSCIVTGNADCQVNETGTSDGNRYDNNLGFLGSTIIGATSVVNGGGPVLFYPFPGTVDIASNALLQAASLPNAAMIRRLRATIKTAPTGQALICDFKKVTLSTGVVGASIGTVTIAAGAFTGSTTLSPNVSLATTEGLVMEVTQVGSGVAGANLSGFADCFA